MSCLHIRGASYPGKDWLDGIPPSEVMASCDITVTRVVKENVGPCQFKDRNGGALELLNGEAGFESRASDIVV